MMIRFILCGLWVLIHCTIVAMVVSGQWSELNPALQTTLACICKCKYEHQVHLPFMLISLLRLPPLSALLSPYYMHTLLPTVSAT